MKRKILLSFIALAWTFNLYAGGGNPPLDNENSNSHSSGHSVTVNINSTSGSELSSQPLPQASTSKPKLTESDANLLNGIYSSFHGVFLDQGFLIDLSKPFPVHLIDTSGTTLMDVFEACASGRQLPPAPLLDDWIKRDVFCDIAFSIGGLLPRNDISQGDNAGRWFRHIHNWLKGANDTKVSASEAVKALRKLGYDPIVIGSQWEGKLEAKTSQEGGIRVNRCAQQ